MYIYIKRSRLVRKKSEFAFGFWTFELVVPKSELKANVEELVRISVLHCSCVKCELNGSPTRNYCKVFRHIFCSVWNPNFLFKHFCSDFTQLVSLNTENKKNLDFRQVWISDSISTRRWLMNRRSVNFVKLPTLTLDINPFDVNPSVWNFKIDF